LLFARVGSGFSEKVLADLYAGMQKLKRTTCLFVNLPEKKRGRWAQSLTPAIMKRCSWVEPVLVAQVKSAPKEMNASEYFSMKRAAPIHSNI
jgi:ATP-dependent DNA ligase